MSKRKAIPKEMRLRVYEKCNHRCAYCGCELDYKDMQVDHMKSVYVNADFKQIMSEEEMNSYENLLPSCRQCNFYKSTMSLEKFRERLRGTMMDNLRKNFGYRLAIKYGLIEEHNGEPVKFYFEQMKEKQMEEVIRRAETAEKHTAEMEKLYSDYIRKSAEETKEYGPDTSTAWNDKIVKTKIILKDQDSVSAVFEYSKEKTALLNFASYRYPGGMFLEGEIAQEEYLCHASNLYNVLVKKQEFYDWNSMNLNRSLYVNRALYSPKILFFKGNKEKECDVITCAAPNKTAAKMYQRVSDQENFDVLRTRIKFMLNIAQDNKVVNLILGAFGCGVFGQDAEEVAKIFMEELIKGTTIKQVIFAIPKGENYDKFKKIMLEQKRNLGENSKSNERIVIT